MKPGGGETRNDPKQLSFNVKQRTRTNIPMVASFYYVVKNIIIFLSIAALVMNHLRLLSISHSCEDTTGLYRMHCTIYESYYTCVCVCVCVCVCEKALRSYGMQWGFSCVSCM